MKPLNFKIDPHQICYHHVDYMIPFDFKYKGGGGGGIVSDDSDSYDSYNESSEDSSDSYNYYSSMGNSYSVSNIYNPIEKSKIVNPIIPFNKPVTNIVKPTFSLYKPSNLNYNKSKKVANFGNKNNFSHNKNLIKKNVNITQKTNNNIQNFGNKNIFSYNKNLIKKNDNITQKTNNNIQNFENKNIFSYNKNLIEKNNYIDQNLIKFQDVERNPIKVNLIHYDENLRNNENLGYYKYLKLNTVGGYYGIDNFEILKKYIETIKKAPIFLKYILIISGSTSEKILNYCNDYNFIDECIIFCFLKHKYQNMKKYKKVKLITNSFKELTSYLEKKNYTQKELDMSNQIPITTLITLYEYKKCIFAFHIIISYFFNEHWAEPKFTSNDKNLVSEFLKRSNFEPFLKQKINEIMNKLLYSKNFTLDCIKYYTSENLCYIFNKTLRDIGKNYDGMSHFVGPFYYALFKFLHDNPQKGLNKSVTLYRDVQMNIFDFYLYHLSLNDNICFISFTSTTILKNLNFKSTF